MIKLIRNGINYTVTDADRNMAHTLAMESFNLYSKKITQSKSPYNQNNFKSHLVGKIGEVAAGNAFTELKSMLGWEYTLDCVYMDAKRDSSCDLIINGLRIEVKTWRPIDWTTYGACISERQAVKMAKKADVVIYGTFDTESGEYILKGFNTMKDIFAVSPKLTGPTGKQVLNRSMEERPITSIPITQPEVVATAQL